MWNKQRRDEEPVKVFNPSGPNVSPAAPSFAEPKKEATTTMSMPNVRSEDSRGNSAIIGKAVKIIGQIHSKEDLYVDGDVEGTVEAPEHKLTVGPNGTVHAAVKAREVVALGSIQGNVEAADRIEIRKDAKLVGDIRTARIIIEDGAYFKGSIDIVKPEPAKVSMPRPQQSAPAAAAHAGSGGPPEIKR
jgi:cytoskeletal protein CcmA (bactofilin family)